MQTGIETLHRRKGFLKKTYIPSENSLNLFFPLYKHFHFSYLC